MNRREGDSIPLRLKILIGMCPVWAGCAILRLPFDILNGVWQIVRRVPIPPPWMF